MRKQLLQHCLDVNCLPDDQYGFLPQRSTVWQLLSVLQDWVEAVDHGRTVHALFIDVAKAFDRVDHRLLSVKLASTGVCVDGPLCGSTAIYAVGVFPHPWSTPDLSCVTYLVESLRGSS